MCMNSQWFIVVRGEVRVMVFKCIMSHQNALGFKFNVVKMSIDVGIKG